MVFHFKKQVANSEIEITINVNLFIYGWQLFENNSIRHIYQNVTSTPEEPEKMSVVYVVIVVVMDEEPRATCKSTDYMSKLRVVVVVFMKPIGVGMVTVVTGSPAV